MVIIFEDYYLFFKMLVGDFMIDDTNYADCLACEEAFDTKKNKMKNFSFISYEKLRKTWMYQVLDLLSKQKLKHFRYLKQRFYDELVNGFYVYAKKKEKDNDDNNVDDFVNYITRYTSRPPMAENRIIKYEDDKKMIR